MATSHNSAGHEGRRESSASEPPEHDYPGRRLGRPETGRGSLARVPRRIVALFIDWFLCLGISHLLFGGGDSPMQSLLISAVFWIYQAVLVGVMGHSIGHVICGMQVQTVYGEPAGFGRAFLRGLLVTIVIPVLVVDADGRGLQDRLVNTVLVRIR
ncbi:RDD family protein [Kocuria massiliensis]|uniref:RDD family protein n=1 Tax=Kocuria massiliensis TaxID=1926282 RepID=UPI0022B98D89|nr:RDD family protein [Kocuria massiliensis]